MLHQRNNGTNYKLTYFNVRGRGEFIRYMFALAEVHYEEESVTFQEWPEKKPHVPFNTLPLLEITEDDKTVKINQSLAIGRFLAKRFGISGQNIYEQALADSYVEGWNDIYKDYVVVARNIFTGNMDAAQEAYKDFKENTLVGYLKRYQNFLEKNPTNSGWLVGDRMTWADLMVGEFIDRIRHVYDPNLLEAYPELGRFLHRLNNLPQIKKRIETRPDWKL